MDEKNSGEVDVSKEVKEVSKEVKEIKEVTEDALKEGEVVTCLKVKADPPDISPEDRKRNVKKLAGAISHALRDQGEISIRCFGSASISKALKSLAISSGYIGVQKLILECSVGFITAKIGENELTGISFFAFASETPENYKEIDIEKCKSILMVKADAKDISPEDRKNNLHKLAGAIAHSIEENKLCVARAFGASALGKLSKAMAVARTYVASRGFDLYFYPRFIVANMNGNERTGLAAIIRSNES